MQVLTVEVLEKRRTALVADLQQSEQQLAMWSEKRGLLRGALMELEGYLRGDLDVSSTPPAPASPETP